MASKLPNKIVKLVFEEVTAENGETAVLKVYLEPTERALDQEMADSDDITLAEFYSSETMEMVTHHMMNHAEETPGLSAFQIDPKKDLN